MLVYVTRGVPLLMLILWSYFLVPLLTGADVPSFVTMLTTLVIYQAAFLSEVVRAGIVALGQGQMEAAKALGHGYFGAMRFVILPQALYNMIPSILPVRVDDQGYDPWLCHQRAGPHLRRKPGQQPAPDTALPGISHPGAHLLRDLLDLDPRRLLVSSAGSPASVPASPAVPPVALDHNHIGAAMTPSQPDTERIRSGFPRSPSNMVTIRP